MNPTTYRGSIGVRAKVAPCKAISNASASGSRTPKTSKGPHPHTLKEDDSGRHHSPASTSTSGLKDPPSKDPPSSSLKGPNAGKTPNALSSDDPPMKKTPLESTLPTPSGKTPLESALPTPSGKTPLESALPTPSGTPRGQGRWLPRPLRNHPRQVPPPSQGTLPSPLSQHPIQRRPDADPDAGSTSRPDDNPQIIGPAPGTGNNPLPSAQGGPESRLRPGSLRPPAAASDTNPALSPPPAASPNQQPLPPRSPSTRRVNVAGPATSGPADNLLSQRAPKRPVEADEDKRVARAGNRSADIITGKETGLTNPKVSSEQPRALEATSSSSSSSSGTGIHGDGGRDARGRQRRSTEEANGKSQGGMQRHEEEITLPQQQDDDLSTWKASGSQNPGSWKSPGKSSHGDLQHGDSHGEFQAGHGVPSTSGNAYSTLDSYHLSGEELDERLSRSRSIAELEGLVLEHIVPRPRSGAEAVGVRNDGDTARSIAVAFIRLSVMTGGYSRAPQSRLPLSLEAETSTVGDRAEVGEGVGARERLGEGESRQTGAEGLTTKVKHQTIRGAGQRQRHNQEEEEIRASRRLVGLLLQLSTPYVQHGRYNLTVLSTMLRTANACQVAPGPQMWTEAMLRSIAVCLCDPHCQTMPAGAAAETAEDDTVSGWSPRQQTSGYPADPAAFPGQGNRSSSESESGSDNDGENPPGGMSRGGISPGALCTLLQALAHPVTLPTLPPPGRLKQLLDVGACCAALAPVMEPRQLAVSWSCLSRLGCVVTPEVGSTLVAHLVPLVPQLSTSSAVRVLSALARMSQNGMWAGQSTAQAGVSEGVRGDDGGGATTTSTAGGASGSGALTTAAMTEPPTAAHLTTALLAHLLSSPRWPSPLEAASPDFARRPPIPQPPTPSAGGNGSGTATAASAPIPVVIPRAASEPPAWGGALSLMRPPQLPQDPRRALYPPTEPLTENLRPIPEPHTEPRRRPLNALTGFQLVDIAWSCAHLGVRPPSDLLLRLMLVPIEVRESKGGGRGAHH